MLGLSTILATVLQASTNGKAIPLWSILIVYIFIFLMMLGAMLIWSELIFSFPKKIQPRLRAFKYTLVISYALVVVFFCILYRNLSHFVLPVIVPLMITMPLFHYLFSLKWVSNSVLFLKTKNPRHAKKIYVIFALVLAGILVLLSNMLSGYLDKLVEIMSKTVVQIR